jgi:hypothetical protein
LVEGGVPPPSLILLYAAGGFVTINAQAPQTSRENQIEPLQAKQKTRRYSTAGLLRERQD